MKSTPVRFLNRKCDGKGLQPKFGVFYRREIKDVKVSFVVMLPVRDCKRLAYGNDSGLVIVDMLQRTCLLNMGTPDLYGTADPYQRAARSPKKYDRDKDDLSNEQVPSCFFSLCPVSHFLRETLL